MQKGKMMTENEVEFCRLRAVGMNGVNAAKEAKICKDGSSYASYVTKASVIGKRQDIIDKIAEFREQEQTLDTDISLFTIDDAVHKALRVYEAALSRADARAATDALSLATKLKGYQVDKREIDLVSKDKSMSPYQGLDMSGWSFQQVIEVLSKVYDGQVE